MHLVWFDSTWIYLACKPPVVQQTRQQNKKKKEGALSDRLPYHIKTRLFLSKDPL